MNFRIVFMAVIICLFMLSVTVEAETSYSGSLSTLSGPDGQVTATGGWAESSRSINWTVMLDGNMWKYNYTLSVVGGGISHMILEASTDNFSSSDISNVKINDVVSYLDTNPDDGKDTGYSIDTFTSGQGNSNPNLPGEIYGIKFASNSTILNISFESLLRPVWGDFYAKDGTVDCEPGEFNTCWNAGFLGNDSPINHIAVPGTLNSDGSNAVPEAGTMALCGTGLATMLSGMRLKRARRK